MESYLFALAFSEWGVGRFPIDLILFSPIVIFCALPVLTSKSKFFAPGNALTTRKD